MRKTIIIMAVSFLLACSINRSMKSPSLINRGDIRELHISRGNTTIKLIHEGLVGSTIYKGKYKTLFVDHFELDQSALKDLSNYIDRARILEIENNYQYCKDSSKVSNTVRIIAGEPNGVFVFIDYANEEIKIVKDYGYGNIYLDSLRYYVNGIIPNNMKCFKL